MKEACDGMYIELHFSQNLALRPKDEVQSAHFSRKQFTLHCSILDPVGYRYHFHLSDDTTHDPVFVDQVLRELIRKYDIKNQDLWIQGDNAPTQYKNKYAFFLLQRLAKEFNLRIIRTFGAAGHGKGAIDGMSSFGVKNILRKGRVKNNIFLTKARGLSIICRTNAPNSIMNIFQAKKLLSQELCKKIPSLFEIAWNNILWFLLLQMTSF